MYAVNANGQRFARENGSGVSSINFCFSLIAQIAFPPEVG